MLVCFTLNTSFVFFTEFNSNIEILLFYNKELLTEFLKNIIPSVSVVSVSVARPLAKRSVRAKTTKTKSAVPTFRFDDR